MMEVIAESPNLYAYIENMKTHLKVYIDSYFYCSNLNFRLPGDGYCKQSIGYPDEREHDGEGGARLGQGREFCCVQIRWTCFSSSNFSRS